MDQQTGNGYLLARVDERTEAMNRKLDQFIDEMREAVASHETRLGCTEKDLAVVKDRLTVAQAIQATFTFVASAIAAFIGGTK